MKLSRHGEIRFSQRGVRPADLDLIIEYASEVDDGLLIMRRDVQRIEADMKKQLDRIQKLEGKYIVIRDDTIVTAFHLRNRQSKTLLSKSQ